MRDRHTLERDNASIMNTFLPVRIERLEGRIAPAGIVTVELTNGILTLTGDGADNSVTVEGGLTNQIRVTGMSGTTLNNATDTELGFDLPSGGLRGINADLSDGGDTLSLTSLKTRLDIDIDLGGGNNLANLFGLNARNLVIAGGSGSDTISFPFTGRTVLRGGLEVTAGDGTNNLSIISEAKIAKGISYVGGTGPDAIFVTAPKWTVNGGIDLAIGSGPNTVSLFTNGTVNGSIRVTSLDEPAASNALAFITVSSRINGDVTIDFGASNNAVNFLAIGSLAIAGKLTIDGGAGNDTVLIGGLNVAIAGGVNFLGGAGTNSFTNDAKRLTTNSLSINGDLAGDSVALHNLVTVRRSASFDLGDGSNSLVSDGNVRFGALDYAGGSNNDIVTFSLSGTLQVLAKSQFDLGAGSGTLSVASAAAAFGGPIAITSLDAGADTFTGGFSSTILRIANGIMVDLGDGASHTFALTGSTSFRCNRTISYDSGAGTDFFQLYAADGRISGRIDANFGDGLNSTAMNFGNTRVNSRLSVNGGSGADALFISGNEAVISGSVSADLGAGDNVISIFGTAPRFAFQKKVKIVSASVGSDSFTADFVRLNGGLDVQLGSGGSTVNVDDVLFRAPTLIDTGDGSDTLNIERDNVRTHAVFAAPVSVQLGDGADTANFGAGTIGNSIDILARLTVDGGAGADSINDIEANNDIGPHGSVVVNNIP
jgi:hypothetical protein